MPIPRANAARWAFGVLAVLVAMAAAAWTWSILVERSVIRDADRRSLEWTQYAADRLERLGELAEGADPDAEEWKIIGDLARFGGVFRFKVFSPEGILRFVSDDPSASGGDLGQHNATAAGVVATGRPFTVVADGSAKENRPDLYSETYLPVTVDGETAAIVEVYFDQTDKAAALQKEYAAFGSAIAVLVALALAIPVLGILALVRRLRRQNAELDAERLRALAADRAKLDFLSTVSHELRTPMNGIIGAAQLLQACDLPEEDKELLEILSDCAESQMTLIEEILTFGEVESGAVSVVEEPLNVGVLMRNATGFATIGADKKGLTLDVIAPDDPPTIVGDPKRLRQVIANLVGNAVKFTESGGVEVRASLDRLVGGRVTFKVDVIDTGPGIAAEHRARIFERFTQGERFSSRKAGGSGLGLAIARGIARELGGDVTLRSEVGKGSTFTMTVPTRIATENAIDQQREAA